MSPLLGLVKFIYIYIMYVPFIYLTCQVEILKAIPVSISRSHFKVFYTSSPPFLYCYAWGVQPAKREEDWGRGLLGCVATRCAHSD